MKLLIFFVLMSFVSLFYVVTSQKEETTFVVEDLDAPTAIYNSTNITGSEFQHGFKSKVGKVVGKVKSKVGKVVGNIKSKITKVVDKFKGGGGGSSGSRIGGGGSGATGTRHRYHKIGTTKTGSGSGSYSNYSVTEILFIVFGLTGGIILLTGIMYLACNKLRSSEIN